MTDLETYTLWHKNHGVITEYEYPPIPSRAWDWSAVRDGYEPGDPIGRGPTEADAIRDLLDQEYGEEGA